MGGMQGEIQRKMAEQKRQQAGGGDAAKTRPGQKLPLATRYIRSLYSVFSGEFAYTESENLFGVFATLVVGFIYGGLAGVLSSIMMTQNAGEQDHMLQMLQVKGWLHNRNLSPRERNKIMAFFNAAHERGGYDEQHILALLPVSLSHEISYHLYARFIHSMPMFSNLGKEILNHLSRLVETTYYVKVRTLGECGDSAPL